MQWQAAPLFATPVFKVKIPQSDRAKAYFENNILKNSDSTTIDTQGSLSHYHSRDNVFSRYSELNWLQEKIVEAGTFVYHDLMNYSASGKMLITNAWFNLCQTGGNQPAHNHVNCLLCGTLYLHTDKNTKILFYNPQNIDSHHSELFDAPSAKENKHGLGFHKQESQVDVNAGECLFWPSRLKHGYQNNQTPNRLSLSFNMMPKKLNVD